ncbi:hypothetical protein BKA70DRAFT_294738 [Coprinopsis sp. MPI-PUGE-AT-0042]|nr:hypothetical protein BKA70DRAFT_294738 [Coprinopsis sp. MPI-PUGE-AT-0042]
MPLDLLFEIFSKLHPLDLLTLARTAKSLRAVLLDRSAGSLWKESLEHHVPGLPTCPDDVSEPAWVDLALGKTCQKCCRNVANQTLVWEARVRYCSRCLHEEFRVKAYNSTILPSQVKDCVPEEWISIKPTRMAKGCHMATLRAWEEDYRRAMVADSSTRQAWITEKLLWKKSRKEFSAKCSKWEDDYANLQHKQQLEDKDATKALILEKIKALGCCLEPENLLRDKWFWEEKEVKGLLKKKQIPDRVWSNVEHEVAKLARLASHNLLEEERKEALGLRRNLVWDTQTVYLLALPANEIVLPPGDLMVSPEMQELLSSTPVDRHMSQGDFAEVIKKLPAINAHWEREKRFELLVMAQQHLEKVLEAAPTGDAMKLAICTCQCQNCKRALDLREALVHPCATEDDTLGISLPNTFDLQSRAFFDHIQQVPWNANQTICFSTKHSDAATQIANLLGHDSKTVTAEELDLAFDILECKDCLRFGSGRLMLDWRGAVEHLVKRDHCPVRVGQTIQDLVRERMEEVAVRTRALPQTTSRHRGEVSFCTRSCLHTL